MSRPFAPIWVDGIKYMGLAAAASACGGHVAGLSKALCLERPVYLGHRVLRPGNRSFEVTRTITQGSAL